MVTPASPPSPATGVGEVPALADAAADAAADGDAAADVGAGSPYVDGRDYVKLGRASGHTG